MARRRGKLREGCDNLGVCVRPRSRLSRCGARVEGKLERIRAERHYKNHDFVESVKIPDLKSKLETFKVRHASWANGGFVWVCNFGNLLQTEHLHYDEEIRFMIDGSGYFDIKWVARALMHCFARMH